VASDFDLAETEDLIEALLARFDHAAFVGMQTDNPTAGKIMIRRRWRGNSHTCMGLCADAAETIRADYTDRSVDSAD
jgi:hypothetical protein